MNLQEKVSHPLHRHNLWADRTGNANTPDPSDLTLGVDVQLEKAVSRGGTVGVWRQFQRCPICVVPQAVGQAAWQQSIKLLTGSHIALCKKPSTK